MEIFGGEKGPMGGQRAYTKGNANAKPRGGMDAMRACSACAGDYEDPDRTAYPLDDSDSENEDCPEADAEEFPAGE